MPLIRSFVPDAPEGRMLDTTAAAESYWHLYSQDKRCMTFEIDLCIAGAPNLISSSAVSKSLRSAAQLTFACACGVSAVGSRPYEAQW